MWLVTSWLTLLLLLPLDIILHSISSKMKRVWGVTAPPPAVRKALTGPGSRIPALLLFPLHTQGRAPVSIKVQQWPPSRCCHHQPGWHQRCQAESVCPIAVLISEIFFWHGCNSRGPGWRDLGIRWWCSYGKRTCQETEYRTRYCNWRSSLMFGFVECEKWLQVDTPAMNERMFLLSFRFIQPSSENRQNRTDYKLNICT